MAKKTSLKIEQIPGQAELGTVEIHGVGAGEFRPELWESGKLNIMPDIRSPLIEPRKAGVFRNIYAPSAVEVPGGWRLFYGAWDGVESGNDRIYSVTTKDFLDFDEHKRVIEHGSFIHVCNVNGLRLPNGEIRLTCTAYPDKYDRNKPAVFHSHDGVYWNGRPAPYQARWTDIVTMEGYPGYDDADINGMNVLFYEDGVFYLYFDNFKDFGKIYRASSKHGKHFKFEGPALEFPAAVNDVKKFAVGKDAYYLMGLHMNTDKLWYSLSRDGMHFDPPKELAFSLGDADKYIVAIGWVVEGRGLLGFMYGAGAAPSLDRNRLFGRWIQKKVTFTAEDGTKYEAAGALGPDRLIITVPKETKGHFTIYDEDGTTVLADKLEAKLVPGAIYLVKKG